MEILIPEAFFRRLEQTPLASWSDALRQITADRLARKTHGDLPKWTRILQSLPSVPASHAVLHGPIIRVASAQGCDALVREKIHESLLGLHPWRKGPFSVHSVHVDGEWRSDWKWARIKECISPLKGRLVLDVGCGNGYYGWRMLGAGAALVLGIEPGLLSNVQFRAIEHFLGTRPFAVLPLGLESLPQNLGGFDTVFSMGVLYHRRSPLDHLIQLKALLRLGGELVLETLVAEGPQGYALVPEGRYAGMRNVWFIPSCGTLQGWLTRCGFQRIQVCGLTVTTTEEQRRTRWMRFHSLGDYLQAGNPALTVEGLPAPCRAIVTAEKG